MLLLASLGIADDRQMTTVAAASTTPCNTSAKSMACGHLGMVYAKSERSDSRASKTTST
ncbi:hypothetical protein C4J97_1841 [Pseudomonas orientalis]|nr:hypothetical protein C4J97_1841 [Pseudomonas orientalis]